MPAVMSGGLPDHGEEPGCYRGQLQQLDDQHEYVHDA